MSGLCHLDPRQNFRILSVSQQEVGSALLLRVAYFEPGCGLQKCGCLSQALGRCIMIALPESKSNLRKERRAERRTQQRVD